MMIRPAIAALSVITLAAGVSTISGEAYANTGCTSAGDPYVVIKSKVGGVGKGATVYKMANGSYCHNGTAYARRDLRTVPRNDGIEKRDCGTQVANSKSFGGGAGRGNGCD